MMVNKLVFSIVAKTFFAFSLFLFIGTVVGGSYIIDRKLSRLEASYPSYKINDEYIWNLIKSDRSIQNINGSEFVSAEYRTSVKSIMVIDDFFVYKYGISDSDIDSIQYFFEKVSDERLDFISPFETLALEGGINDFMAYQNKYLKRGIELVLFVSGSRRENELDFVLVNTVTGQSRFIYKLRGLPPEAPVRIYGDLNELGPLIKEGIGSFFYSEMQNIRKKKNDVLQEIINQE